MQSHVHLLAANNVPVYSSIQQFADNFLEQNDKLDCIINNAGVFMPEHKKTPEGFEVGADLLSNSIGAILSTR